MVCLVKSYKILLCVGMSILIALSGCSIGASNSAVETSPTASDATGAKDTTKPATDDTASNGLPNYNYLKIKQDSDAITLTFDNIINDNKYVGATYMKIGNDFEYLKSSGYANMDEHLTNSINTCYYTGSITKHITASAVMLLCEQGKLSVDDTINKYFPAYKYADKITVKNLLTMTSGIKNYMSYDDETGEAINVEFEIDKQISEDNSAKENRKVIVDWILNQELEFEPDSSFSYSDSNYYLLGIVIEKASGQSYEDFVNEHVTKPMGVTCSGFTGSEKLSVSYNGVYKNASSIYPGVAYSSTGYISNITDTLRWINGLLDGKLLSEESMKEMFTPYKEGFGYGVFVEGNKISTSGKAESYSSMLMYTTDKSNMFVSYTNSAHSDPVYIYGLFNKHLNGYTY